jgi:hypothetical protein
MVIQAATCSVWHGILLHCRWRRTLGPSPAPACSARTTGWDWRGTTTLRTASTCGPMAPLQAMATSAMWTRCVANKCNLHSRAVVDFITYMLLLSVSWIHCRCNQAATQISVYPVCSILSSIQHLTSQAQARQPLRSLICDRVALVTLVILSSPHFSADASTVALLCSTPTSRMTSKTSEAATPPGTAPWAMCHMPTTCTPAWMVTTRSSRAAPTTDRHMD